jgi:ACS family glucarate transporter-like MFS transporter
VLLLRQESRHRVPIRWRIFALLFGIGFIAYVQRESLTIAALRMMPELQLSQLQIGWIEQAFVLGYAIFQLPGGILGQRWGARRTLTVMGVLAFLATALTPLAPQLLLGSGVFVLLLSLQLTLGVAQAAIFPVSTGVFEAWFPPQRWALVQGLQTMGLGLGAAATPPLIASIMASVGWQQALWWSSLPALLLIAAWAWYGRNRPSEHASVDAAELALVAEVAADQSPERVDARQLWRALIDRNVLLLALSYMCMNYVFFMLSNWVFLYLVQELHFSELASGWLATVPPLAAALGAGAGGVITAGLFQRYGSRRGLRLLPLISLPAAALLLLLAVHATSPYWAIGELAACFGCVELSEGSFWAASMTLGRSNTMVVGGLLNTGGNLGGIIGIPIVAALTGHGDWNAAFLIGAGCAVASAAAWLFIDASRSVGAHQAPMTA